VSDFQAFVSALKGTTVTVTNNNFKGLSKLCEEFRFRDLSTQLSQFRESGNFAEDPALLSRLEERIQQHDCEIGALQAELSGQLRLHESFEKRIRTEAESASRRANEVEQSVAEVRSEVENLREALREARGFAEGVQKPARSTEAHLRADFSSQRSGPVVAAPASTRTTLPPLSGQKSKAARAVPPPPSGWDSAIVTDFPKLFEDFKNKQFTLLWRGSRDGFGVSDFHSRCNWHPNTLTVILDTEGNIFGGFTPVEWESRTPNSEFDWMNLYKADPSLKSFVFTLKNPHGFPARRFAVIAEKKDGAVYCRSCCGPCFHCFYVSDNCNANTSSYTTAFGHAYTNDTDLDGTTFFTGSMHFQVKEIEVFEITD
jgi:hypothetical protein